MILTGNTIYFRLAQVDDAEFILSLRTDQTYNKHLSAVNDDLEAQKSWLSGYKEKEAKKEEYYFIVCRKHDDVKIGTVRVYDFIEEKSSFCWGSWILNQDKTRFAALECTVMIYDFAFDELGYQRCHMDMRKENTGIIRYHKRLGVQIVDETELDLLGVYEKADYYAARPGLVERIESSSTPT